MIVRRKTTERELGARVGNLTVTENQQRAAVSVREAVQLRVSKIGAGTDRVAQPRPREGLCKLIGVIGAPLGKVENIDPDGIVGENVKLADRSRRSKRAETAVRCLDRLCNRS